MKVVLGLHNNCDNIEDCQNKGENVVSLSKYIEHPEWKQQIDVAILTLEEPVTFSDKIQPICLPSGGDLYEGKSALLAGWGGIEDLESPNDNYPEQLMEANMTVSSGHCNFKHICYNNEDPFRIGCSGDSGSPVFLEENARLQFL